MFDLLYFHMLHYMSLLLLVAIAYQEYHVITKFTDLFLLFNWHSVYIFLVLPLSRRVCHRGLFARAFALTL